MGLQTIPPHLLALCPHAHQRVPLHVLAPRELLPADLAGVGPLAGVGAHVALEDALVHGREAAVRALELLPDDRELVDWKRAQGKSPGLCAHPTQAVPPGIGVPALAARLKARGNRTHFSDPADTFHQRLRHGDTHECNGGRNATSTRGKLEDGPEPAARLPATAPRHPGPGGQLPLHPPGPVAPYCDRRTPRGKVPPGPISEAPGGHSRVRGRSPPNAQ